MSDKESIEKMYKEATAGFRYKAMELLRRLESTLGDFSEEVSAPSMLTDLMLLKAILKEDWNWK